MANYVKGTIHATYEYQGHTYDFEDEDIGNGIEDFASVLGYNIEMSKNVWEYQRDIEYCLMDAVEVARQFVEDMHPTATSTHIPTHQLAGSIDYSTVPSIGASYAGGRLYADAVDSRGHPYAGHIEYGFTDRIGIPHGPWPFLRPAMRLAAAASQKNFGETMAKIITQGFGDDKGVIRFGSHDAYNNISKYNAVSKVSQTYGKSNSSGKWKGAMNGIGYRSGLRQGTRTNKWGSPTGRSLYSERDEFERGAL